MQLSSRDMKPSWKHSVFKIFCYSSKFMTSENLIRLFPLFRSWWTSPVIKMHVGWLIRAGWPNFWASYQNIQRVENYQLSHLSEGCGKGRTRSKNFAQIPEIQAERAAGVWGYQWRCPELFCLPIFSPSWRSKSPISLALTLLQALLLHLHSLQARVAWIEMLLHPPMWTAINSSGYLT